jgi:hypothetical protein
VRRSPTCSTSTAASGLSNPSSSVAAMGETRWCVGRFFLRRCCHNGAARPYLPGVGRRPGSTGQRGRRTRTARPGGHRSAAAARSGDHGGVERRKPGRADRRRVAARPACDRHPPWLGGSLPTGVHARTAWTGPTGRLVVAPAFARAKLCCGPMLDGMSILISWSSSDASGDQRRPLWLVHAREAQRAAHVTWRTSRVPWNFGGGLGGLCVTSSFLVSIFGLK